MNTSLVLVTTNYPFTHRGGEVMFVAPEISRLARVFGALRVTPQHDEGERLDVPPGVEVDPSLAQALAHGRMRAFLSAVRWPGFWTELWRGLRRGGWIGGVRVWRWAALADVTYRWARRHFDIAEPVIFYTYWRGGSTLALARLARERDAVTVVTRVHGYELYEERFDPPFQPWHPSTYGQIDLTIPVSRHGLDYLLRAGVPPDKLALSRLGTDAPPRLSSASTDGDVRIVSCSFAIPLKRVPMIAEALIAWAGRNAGRTIRWTHFGAGPDLRRVRALLRRAPPNLLVNLPGHVPNETVIAHYASGPVDAFVLLSTSEGLPVSIQEAASAAIPVVATDVGGVRELVGDDNGALLPPDAAVADVVAALDRVLAGGSAMREAARRRWSEGFDAERNHLWLARRLLALAGRSPGDA